MNGDPTVSQLSQALQEERLGREKAQAALRECDARCRQILDRIGNAVVVYEAVGDAEDFIIRDLNKAAERIERIDRGQVIGRSVVDIFPGVKDFGLFEVFQRVWKTGKPEHFPARIYQDDRIGGWRENYVCRQPTGEVMAVYDDVTEQQRTLEALRESQERLAALFTAITDAVYVHEIDERGGPGRIIDANDVACRMLGYTREELLDLTIGDIDAPESTANVEFVIEELKDGHDVLFEQTHVAKDGRRIPVEVHACIFDLGGKPVVMSVVRDITERKQAEEDRLRLEAELRHAQKMEAIGTLAAGIAHDFNNLLTAISGYADLAKSVLASEHPAHQYLDVVESAVRDAGGIANSLLTFSRKTATAKAPVDLRKVLGDSLKLLRRLLPASIEVQASWSEDLPIFVDADVGQMHQVLMNLVTNARDAMPEGGTLRISLAAEGPAAVTGRDSAGGRPAALLVVEDTGVGMTRGVVAKIFDPFFTTKPRSKGTGLGMAMVHGIIERHGGRIEVDSKPGEGTRVSIHLPCCEPPAETAAEQIVATVAARGQNILLAEDDEYVRSLIAQALRGAGYKVADVASGTALLERFRAAPESIALVVLDLDLPRMGGLHCLHEVRKLRPNMPAILITGSPEVAINEDKDKQATMFRKPFKMSALTQAVHRAIAQGPGGSE